jgi:hypothetical protein
MNQYAVQILSILATLLLASSAQAADSPTKEQEALMQREHDIGQAMLHQDAKAIAGIEADEYVFTDPDGAVSGKSGSRTPTSNATAVGSVSQAN